MPTGYAGPGPSRPGPGTAGQGTADYTGLQALRDLTTELGQRGTTVGIARASHLVNHNLKHGTLLKQIGADHLFASVEGAVAALKRSP